MSALRTALRDGLIITLCKTAELPPGREDCNRSDTRPGDFCIYKSTSCFTGAGPGGEGSRMD